MPLADYCGDLDTGAIGVDKSYQRSDRVWPTIARSFLVETVLMGYPMPKLSLHQKTDRISKKTVKQVVDGQQRSYALLDFYSGRLRLSRTLDLVDAAGRTYDELDDELKDQFLGYPLSIDNFVGATEFEVREVFRRMNLYNVPLNDEEQRHAIYQGKFKWYVHKLARDYAQAFAEMELFGSKQFIRMADTKLLTEVSGAYLEGITTTSKTKLNSLYRTHDHDSNARKAHLPAPHVCHLRDSATLCCNRSVALLPPPAVGEHVNCENSPCIAVTIGPSSISMQSVGWPTSFGPMLDHSACN